MKNIYQRIYIAIATTITTIALGGMPSNGYAQGSPAMEYANRAYTKHLYPTAIKLYKKVLKKRPKYRTPKLRIADSYWQLGDTYNAEYWYAQLVVDEKRPEPRLVFNYAYSLQMNAKYDIAEEWFKTLVELDTNDVRAARFLASVNIDTIEKYNFRTEDAYEVKLAPFNTDADEFSPMILNNSAVVYSQGNIGRQYNWYVPVYEPYALKMFQSKLTYDPATEGYKVAKKARSYRAVATFSRVAHLATSYDEQQGMYMQYDRKFCGKNHPNLIPFKLFTAQRQRSAWGYQLPFDYNADEYTCAHPAYSEDGLTIYFASDMPDGYGGMDIYYITFEDGEWTTPKNMGPAINTAGDEVFPFLHFATGKFYFSSNGHGGMGGFDIFAISNPKRIRKKQTSDWTDLQRFGAPINSNQNDYNIYINADDNFGFISSDRKGGKGGVDIYTLEVL